MNYDRMQQLLDGLTYKPRFSLNLHPQGFAMASTTEPTMTVTGHNIEDSYHPGSLIPNLVSPFLIFQDLETDDEFLRFVRACCHWFEIHESDEWLKLKQDGKPLFNPHATMITLGQVGREVRTLMNLEAGPRWDSADVHTYGRLK